MEPIKYRTNRFFASVVSLVSIALIFTIDLDRLKIVYTDLSLSLIVIFFAVILPLVLFWGFSISLRSASISYRSNLVLAKTFSTRDITHVLYQPTWILGAVNNMYSLHIVRAGGGWKDTISIANGFFQERDLADLAQRLKKIKPSIQLDEAATALIKKYED
jgi:hypothetical protein